MILDDHRYIHCADENPSGIGTRVLRITVEGDEQVWVHADDFMDVQKERDDLRRECALMNAMVCAAKPDREVREYVVRSLSRIGFTDKDAEAMLGVIRWAESERLAAALDKERGSAE